MVIHGFVLFASGPMVTAWSRMRLPIDVFAGIVLRGKSRVHDDSFRTCIAICLSEQPPLPGR